MDAARARRLLEIGSDADPVEVEAAFRVRARSTHPDHGGDAGQFRELLAARAALRADGTRVAAEPRASGAPVTVVPDDSLWQILLEAWRARRRRDGPHRRVI